MEVIKLSHFLLIFLASITVIVCQKGNPAKHQNAVDHSMTYVVDLLEDVLQEVSRLRKQLDHVKAENQMLEVNQKELIKNNAEIRKGNEMLKAKFENESEKLISLQNEHKVMRKDVEVLKVENKNLKANIGDVIRDLTSRDVNSYQSEDVFINFRAYASDDRVYQDGEIVIFDSVVVNEGNHYIVENSTFVCPYTGEYMFMFTQVSYGQKVMRSYLMQEGSILHKLYGADPDTSDQSTAIVVTHCTSGQRVWVQAKVSDSEDGGHMWGQSVPYSSFAGFLLRVNTSLL